MEAVREDPGAAMLDEIVRLEVERARVESEIAEQMLAFSDLRHRESEPS